MKRVAGKVVCWGFNLMPVGLRAQLLKQLVLELPEDALDQVVRACDSTLGIGSGAGPDKSGELAVFEVLSGVTASQVVVCDVGANKGQYAESLMKFWSGSGELFLHCFEPSASTFKSLEASLGGEDRVVLNHFGLGKAEEELTLFSNREGSGLASLTKRRLDHFDISHGAVTESVQIQTLTAYCQSRDIQVVDLLKIDVEGHEMDVLHGAEQLFAEKRVRLVQFEFGGCNIDTRTFMQDFFYFFKEYGFRLHRILPSGRLFVIPKYRECDERFQCCNFLAVGPDCDISAVAIVGGD